MSEENQWSLGASLNAWKQVGETLGRVNTLGAKDFEAYLNWTRHVQKDFLEYSWYSYRQLTKATEEQVSFLQRVAESFPVLGVPPKGTGTITGMVSEILSETKKE